jgi:CRP/FNR family cyclic AMP-dependent transcriptional regulator
MNASGTATQVSRTNDSYAPAFSPKKATHVNRTQKVEAFDVRAFLHSACVVSTVEQYQRNDFIFSQGDRCKNVIYIQKGQVKLSVVSNEGKEAVVAILGPSDFIGEGGLARQSMRLETARAVMPSTLVVIDLNEMIRVLNTERSFSHYFISYMVGRNIRIEEDLIDQLFNSCEKRLARTLLRLARNGQDGNPRCIHPKVSQETLAEIIGTSRSRVNVLMKKFEKAGFISLDGGLKVNESLLSVVGANKPGAYQPSSPEKNQNIQQFPAIYRPMNKLL